MFSLTTFAQHSVSGVVGDKNESLSGVNVFVKGTTRGVMSDAGGKYEIEVSGNSDVLVFSFVGYTQQEITVGSRQVIDVTLTEEAENLDEVVVVGYGAQKKVSLTGSVATVSAKDIRNIPVSNLSNALAGRLSGVTIKQSGGGRPGNSSDIVIRARGTWNSTSPLYVIDGIVKTATEFNLLSASDVESISVLKDASTTAIYGSRASNGVILVQTKRGQVGRAVISYSGSVNMGTDFTVMPRRETAAQAMTWSNDRAREVDLDPNSRDIPYQPDGIRYWPSVYRSDNGKVINSNVFTPDEEEYYKANGYDLMDDAWQTPITSTHSVSVSGGTDKIRYYVSGNYYDETGVFKILSYKKFSVRGNIEADIAHGLKAGLQINLNNSTNVGPSDMSATSNPDYDRTLGAMFNTVMMSSPFIPAKVDGKYIGFGNNSGGDNILAIFEGANGNTTHQYRDNEYTATLEWDVPWIKGLNLKTTFNQFFKNTFGKTWQTPYPVYTLNIEGENNHIVTREFADGPFVTGYPQLGEAHGHESSYQWNGIVSYNNTFAERHELGLMLGFEQYEKFDESFSASMTNFDLYKPYFGFGPSNKSYYGIGGGGGETARLSYFGRLNYAFDSRYLFEFSFRRDACVKFDPRYRWGFFPSASAAWRISEESFFKENISFINQLKLRASYGLTGNDGGNDVSGWQWLDNASRQGGMYYGGSSTEGGVAIGAISNPYITWEKSDNLDLGIDIGILDNMFTLSGNYFYRNTYDILGSQTGNLPDTFGADLASSNYGKVNSFGIEVELGFNKRLSKDIDFWARGNFGWADNKLVEWAETGIPSHLSRIGKNWDRSFGFVSDGIIWDMTPNGDGTYNITTSTGSEYLVNHDYAAGRGSGYDIEAHNALAMRPGYVFIKDIGSSYVDEEKNTIYSSTPDGKLEDGFADKTWIVDHINPPYNYGLLLGGSWKGLSLEVFVQGTGGNMGGLLGTTKDSPFEASYGFWSEDHFSFVNNPRSQWPLPTYASGFYTVGGDSGNIHSIWLRDATFIRLKTVSISYQFDQKLVSKIGLNGARIYVTGNNLGFLYNPLKEYDPEVVESNNKLSGFQGGSISGMNKYPLLRSFTVGVEISF
jgi:TonB-linked SusC/RagA family outer membrane protein